MPKYESCFKKAFLQLERQKTAILVHAIITNPSGKRIVHAWLEYKNGLGQECVYDAVTGDVIGRSRWYEGYKPENPLRYNHPMARILANESDMYGPWDRENLEYMKKQGIIAISTSPQMEAFKKSVMKK